MGYNLPQEYCPPADELLCAADGVQVAGRCVYVVKVLLAPHELSLFLLLTSSPSQLLKPFSSS